MEGGGFEPPKAEPSDLQSDPFGHSGTPPRGHFINNVDGIKSLAMSYSHMGKPHNTIGAVHLHFRVRNGIGWYLHAMFTRKKEFSLNCALCKVI